METSHKRRRVRRDGQRAGGRALRRPLRGRRVQQPASPAISVKLWGTGNFAKVHR